MQSKLLIHSFVVLATISCFVVLRGSAERNASRQTNSTSTGTAGGQSSFLHPDHGPDSVASVGMIDKSSSRNIKQPSLGAPLGQYSGGYRETSQSSSANRRADIAPVDTRVPFWNIAHMINSIEQVEVALNAGANGIETDVSFDSSGRPVEAYHGFPCDCGRHCHFQANFLKFVQHLGNVTSPPAASRLLLVLFDLKLKDLKEVPQKQEAGRQMAQIIHENLFARYQNGVRTMQRSRLNEAQLIQPPIRVVVSINHAADSPLVQSFIDYMRDNHLDFMRQHVGFDVGMNDDLKEISAMWDSLNGQAVNIWQGDGLTNCANIVRGVERLKEAISIRNGQGHFRKVYYWTADVLYHIRSVLRLGIDAILTNQPERVLQALEEPEFGSKYRLATPYDDPFQQFWIQPTAWKMSAPSLGEAVETVANIQQTSSNFVKTLPYGVNAVLKKVQGSVG